MSDFRAIARGILQDNDRGGYTVPTAGLYPFQWNWDSAFVAMAFAEFDVPRGCLELERLIEGQWDDGMIPHIVFHQPSDSYFPGADVWRTSHRIPTSGITQPPVFGMAVKALHDSGAPAERIRPLFHAALRYHRWWYSARDPEGTGLVALLHPWESGSDNSPAWDVALARVPTTTTTPVKRKDTGHVDPAMRPRDQDYQRFIHLVDTYAACGWDAAEQWDAAPFKVACVQTTGILLAAGEGLQQLARALGEEAAAAELDAMNARSRAGLDQAWSDADSRFRSLDLVSGQRVAAPTQACFIPLLALDLPAARMAAAEQEMRRWCEGMLVSFPTTPRDYPGFEPRRYWRGSVWPIIDWLLVQGLLRNNATALAEDIRHSIVTALETAGFCEYFDPTTGEPCGGGHFSWTAAAYLHLSQLKITLSTAA
ncbi:hypothetical protein BVG79_01263 [Ketogulonicigenium robustum]|uniref:Mannosylglycerate hydrolase MGH1-like glycoside hydrolase domain-containing protein n=1 Tax=Ketogulonicigenium robustum TaxID=92947 RepID=A0A1W6NZJ6_9RHOB|nr:trehalase family glycosidase [Ketogulonicigenium robustum]ARO14609.1 hypothetical protein BVG79_01263 [Ketogulonicigenium robustum]